MPGRKYQAGTGLYRYGFNGKENDNEVKGDGNQQDYGERIYDPRVGKFLSVDPLVGEYPMLTPYQFASNRPIDGVDQDGLEWKPVTGADGNTTDYTWSGFNADGSAPAGTVSGGTIVNNGATYEYSSWGLAKRGTLSIDDGSNIRLNAGIAFDGNASYSFDELEENGRTKSVFESGHLGDATGASGYQIGEQLNSKYSKYVTDNTPKLASGAIDTDGLGLFDWIGPGEVKTLVSGVVGAVIRKEVANAVIKKVIGKVEMSMARRSAVRQAWKEEKALVSATGRGTRAWTKTEAKQLLSKGKVKGYQGHHINNVAHHPKLAGSSSNIEFLTPSQHWARHNGNWSNRTRGRLKSRSTD